jgi:hypothetical protein
VHDGGEGIIRVFVSDGLNTRLRMMVRDIRVYGELLARQRCEDLAGTEEGFLARLRR